MGAPPSRQVFTELVNAGGRDLRRAAIEAQHTKTASWFRHERPFGGLSDQFADGLAERQPMPLRVGFRHLHGIVLEL